MITILYRIVSLICKNDFFNGIKSFTPKYLIKKKTAQLIYVKLGENNGRHIR